jgi:hypothetical protein
MAFWNCSALEGPLIFPRSLRSVERKAFFQSKVAAIAVQNCNIDITRESFPEGLQCLVVPKGCEAYFAGLYGAAVGAQCSETIILPKDGGSGLTEFVAAVVVCCAVGVAVWVSRQIKKRPKSHKDERDDLPLLEKKRLF